MFQTKKELITIFKSYYKNKYKAKFKMITYNTKKNKLNIALAFDQHKSNNITILNSSGKISYETFVGYL